MARAVLHGGPGDGLTVEVDGLTLVEYFALLDEQPVVFSSWPDSATLRRIKGPWVKYELVDPMAPEPVVFKHCG